MTPMTFSELRERAVHAIESGGSHVWVLSTVLSNADRSRYLSVMSPEEQARAARFRFEADQHRAIAARGGLRFILGRYSGIEPERLMFGAGPHGKPRLSGGGANLEFNVSHSGQCAAIAVTREAACGVDIEIVRSNVAALEIADRFFGVPEREWLRKLPSGDLEKGFFRLWALKEAIIKAAGQGLSIPLTSVNVSPLVLDDRAKCVNVERDRFGVRELDLVDGYAAAIAFCATATGGQCPTVTRHGGSAEKNDARETSGA